MLGVIVPRGRQSSSDNYDRHAPVPDANTDTSFSLELFFNTTRFLQVLMSVIPLSIWGTMILTSADSERNNRFECKEQVQ